MWTVRAVIFSRTAISSAVKSAGTAAERRGVAARHGRDVFDFMPKLFYRQLSPNKEKPTATNWLSTAYM